jgi:lipopolysaccharide/colanic/teichoic acid biosynthesis glycosyltransferase
MIALERKRTERSSQPFVLMLLDAGNCSPVDRSTKAADGKAPTGKSLGGKALGKILAALSLATRETDVTGWYREGEVVGVMFTDIGGGDRESILGAMMARVGETLRLNLSLEKSQQIGISMHIFPEEWDQESTHGNPALYPDFAHRERGQKLAHATKRAMDIVGSALALAVLSPVVLIVALLVKLSSAGPVLFKQQRLGQFGKSFTFLKFRSMYVNNDRRIHQEFMRRVIKGDHDGGGDGSSKAVYKMTNDPRVTKIGWLLRRTSLDELPQFINVLKGDMSLVGPRPPIAYECKEYDIWHRRRVLEIKPGITGLWQVRGRSRVRFDDMVRLDLQYVRTWSVWLDLQILAETPRALFSDDAF